MAASPRAIVSPSVLASNFADLGNEIKRMMHCGAEWVHMGALRLPSLLLLPQCSRPSPAPDVMDGHFVPNITMGAPVLASVNKTVDNVFMDCHMMVADPARVRSRAVLVLLRVHSLTSWTHARSGSSRLQRRAASRTRSTSRPSLTPVRPLSWHLPAFLALALTAAPLDTSYTQSRHTSSSS